MLTHRRLVRRVHRVRARTVARASLENCPMQKRPRVRVPRSDASARVAHRRNCASRCRKTMECVNGNLVNLARSSSTETPFRLRLLYAKIKTSKDKDRVDATSCRIIIARVLPLRRIFRITANRNLCIAKFSINTREKTRVNR